MKNLWIILWLAIFPGLAYPANTVFTPAVIYDSDPVSVKVLRNNININGVSAIRTGTDDPTVEPTPGLQGSMYLRTGALGGVAYMKQDSGTSTNWGQLGAGGSVSSVALSVPSVFTITGSPVTTTGVLAIGLNNQAANRVWAGPASGPNAPPTFRVLTSTDIPNLSAAQITSGGDLTTSTTGVTIGTGTGALLSDASVNIQTASGSQPGLLSAADWTTFNSRQPAGSYITALTGDVTASGPGSSAASVVKLQGVSISVTPPSNGQVLTFSTPNSRWEPATPASGANITLSNLGVTTALNSSLVPAGTSYSNVVPLNGTNGAPYTINDHSDYAQPYTPVSTVSVAEVGFNIWSQSGSTAGSLTAKIYDSDGGGSPSKPGTLLATGSTVLANTITPLAGPNEVIFTFSPSVSLTGGHKYFLAFSQSGIGLNAYSLGDSGTAGSGLFHDSPGWSGPDSTVAYSVYEQVGGGSINLGSNANPWSQAWIGQIHGLSNPSSAQDAATKAYVDTATAGAGTVTSVATGTGLTGGPITTTGTVSLANIANNKVLANISGSSAAPIANSISDIIDASIANVQGDILYRNASGWVVLPPGTSGQFLQTSGAAANPLWTTIAATSSSGATGSVQLAGAAGAFANDSANFFFNSTTHRLGIGTNAPTKRVHIVDDGAGAGNSVWIESAVGGTFFYATGNSSARMKAGSQGGIVFLGSETTHPVQIQSDNTTRITVSSAGAVSFNTGYGAGVSQFDGSGNITSTAPGTSGNVLTSNGSAWVSSAAPSPTGTANRVPYFNNSGALTTNTGFLLTDTLNSYTMAFLSGGGTVSSTGRGSLARGWARGDGPNGAKGINATGNGSFAMGETYSNNVTASGSSSFAGGSVQSSLGDTVASIDGAFAFGDGVNVSGTFATGFGQGQTVSSFDSFVVGRFASAGGTAGSWVTTDPLFVVGNGASAGSPANAFSVRKDGITTMSAYGTGLAQFSSVGVLSSTTTPSVSTLTGTTSVSTPSSIITGAGSGKLTMQYPNTATNYTVVWPNAQGGASTYLQNDGSGNLLWAPVAGGATLNGITAATGSSSIDSGANTIAWAWNSLTSGSALTLSDNNTNQSGNTLVVNSTGANNSAQTLKVTNNGTGNGQGLNITMGGGTGAGSSISANNSSVSSNVTNLDFGLNAASAAGTNARFNHGGSGGINVEMVSSGSTGSKNILRLKNSGTQTTNNGAVLLFNNQANSAAADVAAIEGRVTDTSSSFKGALIFKTSTAGGGAAERVRINDTGLVGFNGNTSPAYTIDYGSTQGDLAMGRANNSNYTVHLGISGPNPSFGTNQADTAIYFNQINSNGSGSIDLVTSDSGVGSDIRMTVAKDGAIRMRKYTAGVSQFDGSGNITSTAPGSSGNILTSNGSAWVSSAPAAASVPTAPSDAQNFALVPSVAGSAMTIALKQADGTTDPAAGAGAVNFAFKGATASTGSYTTVSRTSAQSIVIPSGATLGHLSAFNQYVWVYEVSDSGLELCVSGVNVFDDGSLQSATAITSGATSGSVLYCTSAHTSKPIRLIGKFLVNEATAGTWASNATDSQLMPARVQTTTEWAQYTPTVTALGTVTGVNFWWRRVGENVEIDGDLVSGTTSGVSITFTLPNSIVGSPNIKAVSMCGYWEFPGGTAYMPEAYCQTNSNLITLGKRGDGFQSYQLTLHGDQVSGPGSPYQVRVTTRIKGWSNYGPL